MVIGLKLFDKWDCNEVKVTDISLADHINIKPLLLPYTGAKHTKKQFWKKKMHVVERLMSKLQVTGHASGSRKHMFTSGRNTGKKYMLMRTVEETFGMVERQTKKNPVQVLVNAIQNSAPKGEITSIELGGVRRPVCVDVAPQRRLDLALGFITKGAMQKSRTGKSSLAECLAEELILASNNDMKSASVSKRENLERQAEASR